ncbi:MAG: DUF6356 family protein [Sphingobium sp.]
MFDKIFREHPRKVGETYLQHQMTAWSFGVQLIAAGAACLVHGALPILFERTGSNIVRRLYQRMVVSRNVSKT